MKEEELPFVCMDDEREVKLSEVSRAIANTLALLDHQSESFRVAKEKLPRGDWNALMNTIAISIFSTISTLTMSEEEQMAYAAELSKLKGMAKSVRIVVGESKGIPEA